MTKAEFIFLDNMPEVKWYNWDDIDPLYQYTRSYTGSPHCLVHHPWCNTAPYNGVMVMYFCFDDMKWHFPIFSSSWTDISLNLDDISAWAWIPVQPAEWVEDDDEEIENQMNQIDIWQVQKIDRTYRVKELVELYGPE